MCKKSPAGFKWKSSTATLDYEKVVACNFDDIYKSNRFAFSAAKIRNKSLHVAASRAAFKGLSKRSQQTDFRLHGVQRNAQHLLAVIPPHIILVGNRAVITGDAVSAAVPTQECKHPRNSSKNSQLRTFLECPNEPSPLCLQFQTDGNPAICPASVSLSGLFWGHTEEQRELEEFSSP
ncbi:hypothetical protein F2P81_000598 [Scophthalmus maximus]|uniref:Uncharacterized protein n=1 Tax=Scophthalmus maximus TaxID=52904 RepID=A0A6A4TNU9_SCOMX|nr:hypothetical protein F2P81_000598 [Scophthalmus maximus]